MCHTQCPELSFFGVPYMLARSFFLSDIGAKVILTKESTPAHQGASFRAAELCQDRRKNVASSEFWGGDADI